MVRFLYFAWVRERIGFGEERVILPEQVRTVAQCIQFLRSMDAKHDEALADPSLRVAVNQEYAQLETAITDHDEIAFFPPVSGG
ncbi:MAG: molybdopterin converting factor subunit 1 [Magnetococcales bacterium]|nr:molybdopterin converting factor subunit 1 [Magnetococcales bacterium]MBF0148584.1 molybdopterin converting factor subunit 1 [Magnetococcales bacterium]MBF0172286.1 molybdopterin converting factor subunit 1 [Magnetococcales bacterium]MBF0347313.1 molybdopterin converting factor subunit 1 [Magnetococcales bacterium]MBF0629723.1 molybdopterin converting factor subunit 1 [Magnetococcales bacterium]